MCFADITTEGFFPGVDTLMKLQIRYVGETFFTEITTVGFFSSVEALMSLQS